MEFETKQTMLKTKRVCGTSEFAVNGRVDLKADKMLKKVIAVSAKSSVQSQETVDTTANIQGRIQAQLTYLTTDNIVENMVVDFPYTTNFQVLQAESNIITQVKEYQTYEQPQSIEFNFLVNAIAYAVEQEEVVEYETVDSSCAVEKTSQSFLTFASMGEDKFTQDVKFEIAEPNAQIINVSAINTTSSVTSYIDQVTVGGEILVKVGYVVEGKYYQTENSVQYNQEISCINALPDAKNAANIEISAINYVVDVQEKTSVNVIVSLHGMVETYKEETLNLLKDIYSVEKELEVDYVCKNYSNFEGQKFYKVSYIGDAVVSAYEIVSILDSHVDIAKTSSQNGEIKIEGVITSTIFAKNKETEEFEGHKISIPFITEFAADSKGGVDDVKVVVSGATVKSRIGEKVEFVYDLSVSATYFSETYVEFVNAIHELGDKEYSSSAISIYIAKPNDTVFGVAKALNVLPESLDVADVVDGKFAGGERIFTYNPINVNFEK